MVSEIDGTMTVAEWNTSEVPEDQHETPLLVIHVPIWCLALVRKMA